MTAQIVGIVVCIALPGLIAGLLKPSWFKPIFGKLARRWFVAGGFGLILVISAILAFRLHPNTPEKKLQAVTSNSGGRQVWKDLDERLKTAPKDGPLQYEIYTLIDKSKPLSGRIAIVTPEKTTERIGQLNDTLLAQFKTDGIITDQTQVFYVDYFDDKTVAKDYFAKITDNNVTVDEKRKLADHYVAVLVWQPQLKSQFLTYLPTGKTLKKY